MVFMVGTASAVQPARKPFLKIKIDGAAVKTGDIISVTHGQQLKMDVEMEGGRRDYCKFPDTYADINSNAQILSRGENGLTYELDGKKAEWKLLSETVQFSGEEYLQINSSENKPSAEIIISKNKFSQTYVKAVIKAKWEFNEAGIVMHEENEAEALVYFNIAGSSDVWFQAKNVKATGIKDNTIGEKLSSVQASCDSIEHNMYHLNFPVVQQSIRNLQASITDLKNAIDAAKSTNPSYKINVSFIGLPSDRPFNDIASFAAVKNNWSTVESFLSEQKQAMEKLTGESTSENKKELVRIISNLTDWQAKLPEKTFDLLNKYLPDIHTDSISVPEKFVLFANEKNENDYAQTLSDLNTFVAYRIQKAPIENQSITTASSRIQAFRLFDGMLRSYFNSITWAEWVNTRE